MSKAICRACLDPGGKGFITMNETWKQKYASCIGFKVFPKYVPLMLCKKCSHLIDQYYRFKKLCLANEEVWQASTLNILENKPFIDRDDLKIGYPGSFEDTNVMNNVKNKILHKKIMNVHKKNNSEKNHGHVNNSAKKNGNVNNSAKKHGNVNNSAKKHGNVNKSEKNNGNVDNSAENDENSMDVDSENTSNNDFNPHDLLSVKVEVNDDDPIQSTSFTNPTNPTEEQIEMAQKERLVMYEKSKFSSLLDSLIKYPCGLCKFEGSRRFEVTEHLQQHLDSNMLKCELCEYHGRDFADMIYHRPSHVPTLETNYGPCLFCPKICKDPLTAVFHFRKVHLNQEEGGWCETCGKKYRNWDVFRAHVNLHKDIWNFECDYCGMKFYQKNQIVLHMKSHTLHGSYMCDVCGKGLRTAFSLKKHQNIHFDRTPVKCDHCNKIFKGHSLLEKHLKDLKRERKFTCTDCGKSFVNKHKLETHSICHTDVRPKQCEICHKHFKAQSNYRYHLKTVHKQTGGFECKVCGKKLLAKEALVEHYNDVHKIDNEEIEKMQGIMEVF